jgi:hypothetical protein
MLNFDSASLNSKSNSNTATATIPNAGDFFTEKFFQALANLYVNPAKQVSSPPVVADRDTVSSPIHDSKSPVALGWQTQQPFETSLKAVPVKDSAEKLAIEQYNDGIRAARQTDELNKRLNQPMQQLADQLAQIILNSMPVA